MDIEHIEWMMEEAILICQKEELDDSLLLPLVILHDVGYSKIKNVKKANYYQSNIRREHMKTGKQIAIDILGKVNYPKKKIDQIAYYISIHDNWSFGEVELYINDRILGTFKDLDYLWIFTPKGFLAVKKVLHKTNKEMLAYLKTEPSPIGGKKPFSTKTTQQLHDKYLNERKKAVLRK